MKFYFLFLFLFVVNFCYSKTLIFNTITSEIFSNLGDTTKKKLVEKKPVKEEELVITGDASEILVVDESTGDDSLEIFLECEVAPIFPGGFDSIDVFLSKNLKYPAIAKENGIEGRVVVRFVVEKVGTLTNITLLRKVGWGCDDEATRLIKQMPKWIPGKMNGKPVRVYFTLPILFKLK